MLGTGDKAEETDLAPALAGLTEQRPKQSRPPKQAIYKCQEMGAVLKAAVGGGGGGVQGAQRGHPTQLWQEGLWLFNSLLSAAPSTCRRQEYVPTQCQSDDQCKSNQHVKVQLRSCTSPGRLLRPPRYHSYWCTRHSLPRSSRAETCVWYLYIPSASMHLAPQDTSHCS